MAERNVEVIDLTESVPQSPITTPLPVARRFSPSKFSRRDKRSQKRSRTESSTSAQPTPIVISDGDDMPPPPVSIESVKKKSKSKPNKKKLKVYEEGEVAHDADGGSNSLPTTHVNSSQVNENSSSRKDNAPRENGRTSTQYSGNRRTPSPARSFYFDDKPGPLVAETPGAEAIEVSRGTSSNGLLLPAHVQADFMFNEGAPVVAQASAMLESDDEEFIHYVDMYETRNNGVRYYDEPENASERRAHYVCGHCGAEGDHKTMDCPVVICLTCGAHNEHSTRGCPIIKTCFCCGLKGHINKDCPNRFTSRRLTEQDYYYDCGRCGSHLHVMKECPTLWRMYEYVDDAEREATLRLRKGNENLQLGQGGEGCISEGLWCYNCGNEGHLGDDCDAARRPFDYPKEPSAFGSYNTMSGPFADYLNDPSPPRNNRREWEADGNFDDGHGFAGPSDVGKLGRDKERERMRRQIEEFQQVDEDDWFGNRMLSAAQTHPRPLDPKSKKSNERMVFKFQDNSRLDYERPRDRLLLRISSRRAEKDRERSGGKDHDKDRDRDRQKGKKSDCNRGYEKSSNGSKQRERDGDSERDRDRNKESGRSRRDDIRRDGGRFGRQYYGGYGTGK